MLCEMCFLGHLDHAQASVKTLPELAAAVKISVRAALLIPNSLQIPTPFVDIARNAAICGATERDALSEFDIEALTVVDDVESVLTGAVRSSCSVLRDIIATKAGEKQIATYLWLESADAVMFNVEAIAINIQRALDVLSDVDIVTHASAISAQVQAARETVICSSRSRSQSWKCVSIRPQQSPQLAASEMYARHQFL